MAGARDQVVVSVGSANPLKIEAVRRVFSRYYNIVVKGVTVDTSVPKQPVGIQQLLAGALVRAVKSREAANAYYGVGIEAGLLEFYSSTGFLETQIAAIVGPGNRVSVATSSSFELPPWIVDRMLDGEELGSASGILRGSRDIGESIGYIGVKTWGYTTRLELTMQAVEAALMPWLEGGEWLIRVEELARRAGIAYAVRG